MGSGGSGLLPMSTVEDTIVASLGGLRVHSNWESWRNAVVIPEDVRCALEAAVGSQGVAALSKSPVATYARVITSRRDDSVSSRVDNAVERLRLQGYSVTKLADWHAKLNDCIMVSLADALEMDSDLGNDGPHRKGGGEGRREREV